MNGLPLYPNDVFGENTGMLLGTLIGMAFGFTLERAGFGRAPVLAAQFYLTDTRVFKVMFSAIVTAAVGIGVLSGFGALDLAMITVPETFVAPQIVGGLVFGAGFIVSGLCPGTSIVAAASGNLDGLVTYVGVILGSVIFGLVYPALEGFYLSGALGVVRLDTALSLPFGALAFGVFLMAAGCFLVAEKLERIFSARAGRDAPPGQSRTRNGAIAALATAAVVALVGGFVHKHEAPVAQAAAIAPAPVKAAAATRRTASTPSKDAPAAGSAPAPSAAPVVAPQGAPRKGGGC